VDITDITHQVWVLLCVLWPSSNKSYLKSSYYTNIKHKYAFFHYVENQMLFKTDT